MKRPIQIITIIVLTITVYSLLPVLAMYLKPGAAPYTNEQAAERLKGNRGDHFEFIVLGDNHAGLIFDDSAALKLIRRINREDRFKGKAPVDFVIIAGDVTLGGSKWDYLVFNKIRSAIKWPVICAFGNHDDDRTSVEYFRRNIGNLEFSCGDRNSYFIFVDNGAGDMSDEQFAEFEAELKKSAAYKHRFVIAHKAPLSSYQQSWYRPETGEWPRRFMDLCDKYDVGIVFSGHEHMFKQRKFGKVNYITTGGGGMLTEIPASDGGFLHYVVVRVYGDYVDYEVRKIFPPFWEFLTYYMWKDVFYFLKDVLF